MEPGAGTAQRHSIECPVCGERMTLAHADRPVTLFACLPCGTSVTVPDSAWRLVSSPTKLLADGRF